MWLLSDLLEHVFVRLDMVNPGQESALYTITYSLLGLSLAVTIFCIYYGLWFGPKQSLRQLNPMTVIVTDKQCAYSGLQTAFEQMMKDLKELESCPNARTVGIYLDNPMLVKEQHMCRCMLGYILASPQQQEIAERIAFRSHRYKIISLPAVQAIHLAVPMKNVITYFLMGFFWGKIRVPEHLNPARYAEKKMAAIEIYNYTNPSNKEIHLYMPVGRYSEYIKSAFPKPEYTRSSASNPSRPNGGYSRSESVSRSRPVSRGKSPQPNEEYQAPVSERSNPYSRPPSQRIDQSEQYHNTSRVSYADPLEQFRMSNSSPVISNIDHRENPSPRRSQTFYKSEFY